MTVISKTVSEYVPTTAHDEKGGEGKTLVKFVENEALRFLRQAPSMRPLWLTGRASVLFALGIVSATACAGDVASSAKEPNGSSCYRLVRLKQERQNWNREMPAVCPALLEALNDSCGIDQTIDLKLPKPVAGLALPQWEPIALDKDSMRTLEEQVRGKWKWLSMTLPPLPGEKAVWRARDDQEWEIARRAIGRARQLNQPVTFERSSVTFKGHRTPTVFYRLRIDRKPKPSASEIRKQLNSLDQNALLYGISPELYAGQEYGIAIGSQAAVTYDGIGYVAALGGGSVDLAEVLTAPTMMTVRGVCRLQIQSTSAGK
jgi:hypothetical protein